MNKLLIAMGVTQILLIAAVATLYFCPNVACHSAAGAGSVRLGFVKSYDILQSLPQVAAAKADLDAEAKDWGDRRQKLEDEITAAMKKFDTESYQYSNTKRVQEQEKLRKLQEKYQAFGQDAQEQLQRRQSQILEPVLNEINGRIEDWGYKNGYTIIFGVEQPGVLVHADSTLDVTEKIREALKNKPLEPPKGTK